MSNLDELNSTISDVIAQIGVDCPFFANIMQETDSVVYGSLLWRVVKKIGKEEKAEIAAKKKPVVADDDKSSSEEEFDAPGDDDDVDAYMAKVATAREARRTAKKAAVVETHPAQADSANSANLANLASAVIKDISEAKGDIDIFVESSKPLPVEYRSLLSYGWLAYRHERNVVNFRKEILVSRLLSGHGTTIAELNMLLSKTKMLVREDAELNIDKFEIPTTFANGEKITMQVHRARESKQLPWPALENPRNLLNDVVAPFFTVEALMWDSTQGLSCRFGVPMDMVLRHIENREIHLANSKELISYMDTLKQYRDSRGLCSRLIYRLLKYKRYGFSLCLNKEEIRCKFMPALIKKMMDTYVRPLSTEEKKKISRGMRFAEDWVQVSARTYEKSENAWATQSLHNEYIASVVGESKDLPIEISTIISEYASRSDEDVYYEDPVWRERVAYARARVEDAQKELQMRLAE